MFFGTEKVLPAARTAKEFDGLLKKTAPILYCSTLISPS